MLVVQGKFGLYHFDVINDFSTSKHCAQIAEIVIINRRDLQTFTYCIKNKSKHDLLHNIKQVNQRKTSCTNLSH